jgi:hypothetical protein
MNRPNATDRPQIARRMTTLDVLAWLESLGIDIIDEEAIDEIVRPLPTRSAN